MMPRIAASASSRRRAAADSRAESASASGATRSSSRTARAAAASFSGERSFSEALAAASAVASRRVRARSASLARSVASAARAQHHFERRKPILGVVAQGENVQGLPPIARREADGRRLVVEHGFDQLARTVGNCVVQRREPELLCVITLQVGTILKQQLCASGIAP